MTKRYEWIVAVVLMVAILGSIGLGYFDPPLRDTGLAKKSVKESVGPKGPIVPLPLAIDLDGRKVALGSRLFNDARLSGDGTIACSHCHNLATGGVDRLPRSFGIGGQEGDINAPTVFNSGFNFRQFWNGRAESLEEQATGPLTNPKEMGSTWERAKSVLASDKKYQEAFSDIYQDGIQLANFKDAVATFERSLSTPNSRFDRYLQGETSALNADELAGYRLFKQAGCISCHQGINIGGNMYQKLGIMENYFVARGNITSADFGLYNITKREQDKHFFKVPSLRNVALTAPYLHDGSAKNLEDVVKIMARYQLGTEFTPGEISKLVGFLRTLTGEYQGKPLE